MEIFKLFGSIFVNNEAANNSISETSQKATGLMSKVGEGIKTVAKVGAAVGGAVVAGATALTAMATKAAETCDRIDKLSAKTGLSKQAFQEWDYVLAQNGMSIETLQVGNKTLLSYMEKVTEGNADAVNSFKKLDVAVTDSSGKMRATEDVMNDTIIALAKMENGSEKTRLAQTLFGKAGTELLPMLNNGAESIEELTARAHELGLVMSDDAVNAGVVLGDTMDDVKKTFGAIMTQIGVKVMPLVQKFLDLILEYMPVVQKVFGVAFGVIEKVVSTAVDIIGKFIGWIQKLVSSNEETGSKMSAIWESIKNLFSTTFELIGAILENAINGWKLIWNLFGDEITTYISIVFNIMSDIFKTAFDLITGIFNVCISILKGDWEGAWNGIKETFITLWDNIKTLFSDYINGLVTLFTNIIPSILQVGKDIMSGLWNGIKEVWDSICAWINEKVTWLAEKLMFWKKSKDEMASDSEQVENKSATKSVSNNTTNKTTSTTVNNNYTVNTYSPKALSAADTAKEFKKTTRNLALGV